MSGFPASTNAPTAPLAPLAPRLGRWCRFLANRPAAVALFVLVLCLATAGADGMADEVAPAAPRQRTLAVLSVDAGTSQGIADLIMVRLQQADSSLSFVERDRLKAISDEQAMALAGAQIANRIAVGKLVGADLLVLVGRQATLAGEMIRLLVCDCATGVRLGQARMPANREGVEPLVQAVRATLARFPDGVESAITIPDFICRDLESHYRHLQNDLAELLREGLSARSGLAVVEIDEAKAIGGELALHGTTASRRAPLAVAAEYRTDRLAKDGPQIAITVGVTRAGQEVASLKSGPMPIGQAGLWVMGEVQHQVVSLLGTDRPDCEIDLAAQSVQLVRRADQFAEIGDFERSAALREAVLLLRPDDDAQRLSMVKEYTRWILEPEESLPHGAKARPTDPHWRDLVARAREYWRRSLVHLEHLIRNRRVTMDAGTELFGNSIHSLCGILLAANELGEEETLKKEFIRNVAPALFRLDPPPDGFGVESYRQLAAGQIAKHTLKRVDHRPLAQEDLTLMGDLVCDIMPEDMPYPYDLLSLLGGGIKGRPAASRYSEPWPEFVNRLARSDRPTAKAYAMYAMLCYHRYHEKGAPEKLLAEANQLLEYLDEHVKKKRNPGSDLRGSVSRMKRDLELKMGLVERPAPPQRPDAPKAGPVSQPDGSLLCERVRLKPLVITLALRDKRGTRVTLAEQTSTVGYSCWDGIVPAWPGTDVIYSSVAVLFVGADRTAREVLTGRDLFLKHLAFDGRHLWVSGCFGQGIFVLDETGKTVARATAEQGLPPAYRNLPILILEQGRILAASAIEERGRSWLATVALEPAGPRVKVFHEAVKAWTYGNMPREMILDPAMRFDPYWMAEFADRVGNRWVAVDRYRSPLLVNVKTLETAVCALNEDDLSTFPRREPPGEAYLSQGNRLYVAGSMGDFKVFEMDPGTKAFTEVEKRDAPDWHVGGPQAGRLVVHDGHLVYAGEKRWLHRNLRTGEETILIADRRSLPNYGSGGNWHLYSTRCFGLVAKSGKACYQVSFTEP